MSRGFQTLVFGIAFFCVFLFWLILYMCPRTQPQEDVQSELSVNVPNHEEVQSELSVNAPNQTVKINMEQMEQDLPPSYSYLYGTELTERFFTIEKFLKEYVN